MDHVCCRAGLVGQAVETGTCSAATDLAGALLGSEQGQRACPIPSMEQLNAIPQLEALLPS